METMGEISDAMNLISVKKENLRRSFLQLQSESQSPSSFNFNLNWTDLDSYFTTLCSSLNHKFHVLQTLYPSSSSSTTRVIARPQLKSLCQNSDGLGLRRFLISASGPERLRILSELPDAYRCAPDAAAMILEAMEGFYSPKSRVIKSCCVLMLEGLMQAKAVVTRELMEKAMEVAVQWNQKGASSAVKDRENNAYGFLLLVGAYGLINRFSMDGLIDCVVIVARRDFIFDLCRQMIPADKISDVIQKLISKQMQVVAVRFCIEFQKTHEFPPVALLEDRKLISEQTIEETRGKNEIKWKEVNTLKSIIRCIDDYHLEAEDLKKTVVDLIKKLETEMGIKNRKKRENEVGTRKQPLQKKLENEVGIRKLAATGNKQLPLNKKPKLNKFLKAAVPTSKQNFVPHRQPHIILPGHYHTSPAPTASYAVPIVDYTNPMPASGSSFYIPQPHPPSEYHPCYYPQ